jgi:uncharacterized 2Fe-2S/4Fe-4S cluster protein (DUF4445 family)
LLISNIMPRLSINNLETEGLAGVTLFEAAEAIGVQVPTSCRKQGKGRECLMEIVEGSEFLSERVSEEEHLRGSFRLACRTKILPGAGEVHCHTLRRGQMRIVGHGSLSEVLKDAVLEPCVTRDGDLVLLDGVEIDRTSGPIHGLAVDLGTTTVVVRLYNLETGELVADASFENPQRFAGSEIMARIQYDTEIGGHLLMRTLAGYLAQTIAEFPIDPHSIYEAVIVGNSTMRDLFFRQNVYSIGQTPYQSITEIEMAQGQRATTSLEQSGQRSLLPVHPKSRVYGGPIISGHVGADAAACMLAIDIAHEERLVAIMDIGTNTELIVGNRKRIVAASCPAGPAFEGGAISCGMPGLNGAIERVRIGDDGAFLLETIGDLPPEGICGSGLITLLSELLRTGQMNEFGRFENCDDRIVISETNHIFLHERDVNELAQAKGANVAGLQSVFSHLGINFDDIDVFYLAGGFGCHLDVEAALRIGLIPDLPIHKVHRIGNAAIEGASLALLSQTNRAELEQLVRRVEHCRLESHPDFFDFFVEGCQFKSVVAAEKSNHV